MPSISALCSSCMTMHVNMFHHVTTMTRAAQPSQTYWSEFANRSLLRDQYPDSRRHCLDWKWLRHYRHSRLQMTLADHRVLRVTYDERDFQVRTVHASRVGHLPAIHGARQSHISYQQIDAGIRFQNLETSRSFGAR